MSGGDARDEFPESVKRDLCDRVGALCSRPDCRVFTKGPRADSNKAKSIGRAAHIHAAAPGGPRYDTQQTSAQRRSFENGIWLCANCAAEVDDDKSRFSAEELRAWKREADRFAAEMFGKRGIVDNVAATRGLIAIGPDVIVLGRVLRTTRASWSIGVDSFVLGDMTVLRHFADAFSELVAEDCYVCVEADGVGRMLVEAPATDVTSGIVIELHVAAPMPRDKARTQFDANLRGADIALDLSGDEPDLDPMFRELSGVETIAQTLVIHLSTCKGGYCVGGEHGSRVAELYEKLDPSRITSVIALETIRLATVPHADTVRKKSYVPFDFVERVRRVRLLPTTSTEFLKAALTLDVYGVGSEMEFVVLISTSTKYLGPPPSPPSRDWFR